MADRTHSGAGRGAKWRVSLPETENISTPRSASPLVFRSSTPNYDDESNQTSGLDKNDDLQSRESGGKKRKMSTDSNLIQKKHKENKKTKWVWSVEKVEEMLKFLREYRSTCDFHGVDFEADLQALYTEVRRCMATLYPDEFGTPSVTETETSIKDMGKEEYQSFKSKIDEEKLAIKKGYERVKEKIKNIRQDYRTAVNKGSRSGSGKIVKENFDLLNEIWGGSPATNTIPCGIDGDLLKESVQDENDSEVQGM